MGQRGSGKGGWMSPSPPKIRPHFITYNYLKTTEVNYTHTHYTRCKTKLHNTNQTVTCTQHDNYKHLKTIKVCTHSQWPQH